MIWDYQAQLARRLLLWGMLSAAAGTWLIRLEAGMWQAFGIQALLWGAINTFISVFSLQRARKRLNRHVDLQEAGREASSLRRLLRINMAMDVLYVVGGAALVIFRGSDEFLLGSGWGILLQGAFLLIFDGLHVWKVPEEYVIPDLGILEEPEHRADTLEGGEGAILLVHGFPGTPAELRGLGQALQRKGWTVRLMRLPGHGSGYRSLLQIRAPEWERAVQEELAVLRVMHKPVLLAGYSLGAGLSVPVAAECQPDGLILLAPFWIDIKWWMKVLIFMIRPFLPTAVNPFKSMRINLLQFQAAIEDIIPEFDLNAPRIQAAMGNFRLPIIFVEQFLIISRRLHECARRIGDLPMLVVQAENDILVPVKTTKKLVGWLGPNVRLVEVPGDHNLNLSAHPGYAMVERAMIDFSDGYIAKQS